MLIHLDDALRRASREEHSPEPVTARQVLDGLAQRRRAGVRRAAPWLVAGAVLLAALVAFLSWYQPRLGPAPTPSPTPAPAYVWDRTAPDSTNFEPEEARRRCHVTAQERLDEDNPLSAGSTVQVLPRGVPSATGTGEVEPLFVGRTCYLGYQQVPVQTPPTADQLTTTDPARLTDTCTRATGFDLHDRDWHVLVSRAVRVPGLGLENLVAFTSDSGWLAVCELRAGLPITDLTFTQLERRDAMACQWVTWMPVNVARNRDTVAHRIMVSGRVWSWDEDHNRLDQRWTGVDVSIAAPVGQSWHFPMVHGLALLDHVVTTRRPVDLGADGGLPQAPMTLTLTDDAGHRKDLCTE